MIEYMPMIFIIAVTIITLSIAHSLHKTQKVVEEMIIDHIKENKDEL